jgi:hypothetical protein
MAAEIDPYETAAPEAVPVPEPVLAPVLPFPVQSDLFGGADTDAGAVSPRRRAIARRA